MTLGHKRKMTWGREFWALNGKDKEDQLESGQEANGYKSINSKCRASDYQAQERKYAPISKVLTLLKQPINQSTAEINGSETDVS